MVDRTVLDGKEVESQDVEITAEMLSAGEAVFEHLWSSVSSDCLVAAIYRAMHEVSRLAEAPA